MELTSTVPSKSTFFGVGESAATQGLPIARDGKPHTLWNRDRPSRFPDENLYGAYPFLLELREGELQYNLWHSPSHASLKHFEPLKIV